MRLSSFTRCGIAALSVAVLAACGERTVTEPLSRSAPEPSLETTQDLSRHIFVLTEEDIPSGEFREAVSLRGGLIENSYDFGVVTVLGLDDDEAQELGTRADVDAVDRDMMVKWVPGFSEVAGTIMEAGGPFGDQSDAFYYAQGMQWNIPQVAADEAWAHSNQGSGEVVAVLDTGGDPFHIDLEGKIKPQSASLLTPGSSACGAVDEDEIWDLNFHGTFVSGMVTSNGLAIASVAPEASILTVKVLDCTGSGSFNDIIAGIKYAADERADVINMSLGAYFSLSEDGAFPLAIAVARAIAYATIKGSVVVASSGNGGINLDTDGDFIHIPSQLPLVISVGATAPFAQMDFDMLATYTNYGVTGVDIMAPGGDLVSGGVCGFAPNYRCDLVVSALSSFLVGGAPNFYTAGGGTSFASPMAAGAIAVVESTRSRAAALCVLRGADDLGDPGIDPEYGLGRLNVMGGLRCR